MIERTVTVWEGEAVGPIDWGHPTAMGKPLIWRDAEKDPQSYTFQGRGIIQIAMYDGWPFWTARPAIQFIGPLNSAEWTFFDSYSVHNNAIRRRVTP